MAQAELLPHTQFDQALEQLAAQRETLLDLIRPLSNTMQNWKPNDSQWNIHEILLHIGMSECQTVSGPEKKVSPPSEVTLIRYLHQSRESVLVRLHQLNNAEQSHSFAENRTIAHVLDQLLTHEQEHIAQIKAVMSQWRLHLIARLTAERASLFAVLLGLSEAQLTTAELMPGMTMKDLLVHVAFWDGFHTNRMQMVVDGRIQEIMEIGDDADMDAFNAKLLADQKEMPLEQAVAMLQKERGGFVQLLKRLSDAELQNQIRLPWGWRTHMRVWARWRFQHDAEHGQHIQAWRNARPRAEKRHIGPKYILRAALMACRKEFVSLLPLLPESDWGSQPVCGVWTMKDLVGHLAAWAEVGGLGLDQAAAGEKPVFEPISDFEAWNMVEAAKRSEWPWDTVWEAYETSFQALLDGLDSLSDDALAIEFETPWGGLVNLYRWLTIWPLHEREHAIDVRQALNLTRWPKRLTEHPR